MVCALSTRSSSVYYYVQEDYALFVHLNIYLLISIALEMNGILIKSLWISCYYVLYQVFEHYKYIHNSYSLPVDYYLHAESLTLHRIDTKTTDKHSLVLSAIYSTKLQDVHVQVGKHT